MLGRSGGVGKEPREERIENLWYRAKGSLTADAGENQCKDQKAALVLQKVTEYCWHFL